MDDTNKALKDLNSSLQDAQEEIEDIQDDLEDLQTVMNRIQSAGKRTAGDLRELGGLSTKMKERVQNLTQTLADLELTVGTQDLRVHGMDMETLNAQLQAARTLESLYVDAQEGISQRDFITGLLILQGMSKTDAAQQAGQLLTLYATVNALVSGAVEAGVPEEDALDAVLDELDTAHPEYDVRTNYPIAQKLVALHEAVQAGMEEETFFCTVLKEFQGYSAAAAKESWDLFQLSKNLTANALELCELLDENHLAGNTADLLDATGKTVVEIGSLTDKADALVQSLDDVLDSMDDLHDVFDQNVPGLKQTLEDTKTLITGLTATVGDTNSFLETFETLMKAAGTQADAGTKQTLEGLAAALRATAKSLNTTGDVKQAKQNINSIIEDTWEEYTGDTNNLLLMDATADAVSLTDSRNPAPGSIQMLIRTQEIQMEEAPEEETAAPQAADQHLLGAGDADVPGFLDGHHRTLR